jgi:DnaJ-domain-containing protein 1
MPPRPVPLRRSDAVAAHPTRAGGDPASSDALMRRLQAEDAFSGFVTEDEIGQQLAQAEAPSELEKEFEAFADRMKSTRRSFFVTAQQRSDSGNAPNVFQVRSSFFENDDDAVRYHLENEQLESLSPEVEAQVRNANKTTREKWMNCCRLEFGKRRRKFHARFPSMKHFVMWYFIPILLLVAGLLYLRWPVWDILIDIDTDEHCKTLGITSEATPSEIKKAYRQLVKQWHPDLNPDCGSACRNMMMKIQAAHDTLLEKGDRSNDLAKQYKEALLQLRSLLFFRSYQMAFHSSEFVNMLLLTKDGFAAWLPFLASRKASVRMFTALTTIFIFAAMEIIYVSGFNVVIILQIFYFTVNALRSSSDRVEMEKISKRCNFDILRDLGFFVLPCIIVHVAHFLFFAKYPQLDQFVPQMVVGVLFLMSHLARFAPNLFDNFAFRKCSISLEHVTKPDLKFSRSEFIKTEIGVLFDDLFAFSSHVPLMFRLAALLVHAAYLVQMRFLPWDAPAIGKLQSRFMKQDDEDSNDSGKAQRASSAAASCERQARPLSDRELQLFSSLDQDDASWLSIVGSKYHQTMLKHVTAFRQSSKCDENTKVECQLRASHDLKSLVFILAHQKPNQPAHFELRQTIFDPESAGIVAREVGVTGVNMFPDPKNPATSPEQVIEHYKLLMGHDWEKMCSDLFRDETAKETMPIVPVLTWLGFAILAAVAALLLVALAGSPVLPAGTEREVFDPFIPPMMVPRFGHILPGEHLLNAGGGNVALRFTKDVPLVTPDLFDTLRQLSMYSTDEDDPTSKSVQNSSKSSKTSGAGSREQKSPHKKKSSRGSKNG